jgi:CubicO group peptidase (beta-lactamase class C family)
MGGRARVALLAVLLLSAGATIARAQIADRPRLVAALDSAARAHADLPNIAGVSVAVVRGADTLLMRGYGEADLEWHVPTPVDGSGSYEIGSITKQFTAAAIMQLVEAGELDLDADFTTYLPEFDAKGHQVPLRRLLDHTSGIKGYTEMPVFGDISVRKLPRDSLVTLVEAEPFEFEPGTAQIYNNSAYFLLGLIIEKVTGQKYEEYVADHLFRPVGMTSSYYCSENAVREKRAHGYDASPDGLVRKAYLDHTWPFAAGSLCSTVGDMVAWNQALHGGRVVSDASYRAMTTPRPLVDGTPIRYAMGLGVDSRGGRRTIAHGGGINGFLSDGRYYPDEGLIVIVLQNTAGAPGPGALGQALVDLVLGPLPETVATPFTGDVDELLGTYVGPSRGREMRMVVSRAGDDLVFAPEGAPPQAAMRPKHLDGLTWEQGGTRLWFVRGGGAIVELRVDQGGGHYVLKRR